MSNCIILGSGIAGLGAAYTLRNHNQESIILERDDTHGGLCGNFVINGFRFDRFIHLSFTTDEKIKSLFQQSSPEKYHHTPNPYNVYKGIWLKHPAQNNLYPLPKEEKDKIIADFEVRSQSVDINKITNYEEWLRIQFGNYFAEHFPMVYTKKYWMDDAKNLETKWVGSRLYQPSLDEVIQGAITSDTPVTYYAKEMRYPKKGGFKQFLSSLVKDADIRYKQNVVKIDSQKKVVITEDGSTFEYNRLISSLPLPEVIKMLSDVPQNIILACDKLRCTCGYQVSIGLKTKNIPPYLWWYIYDEDILPARVYSPSFKSPNNAPKGCSSLQLEIYCEKDKYTQKELLEKSVDRLIALDIIKKEDILFVDVRFEKYANVIFNHHIYENRKVVRDYLSSIGIETIGRFGEWDYLWSDQSLLSGLNITV